MSKPHCTATTSREQTPLVRARNVHKYFGDNHVLHGIDLDVNSGKSVVILGGHQVQENPPSYAASTIWKRWMKAIS